MKDTQLTPLEPDRILTAAEVGLAESISDGPAKLLAALFRRGLQPEHLHEAVRIIVAWDLHAPLDELAQVDRDAREAA